MIRYKNIYDAGDKSTGIKLKNDIEKNPQKLLMFLHDKATFKKFQDIVEAYPDAKNPFAESFKENGAIRKYSRKSNGPEIYDIKYLEKKLVLHRENKKQRGKNQSVYLNIKSYRVDIYQVKGKYKFVNVTYDMIDRIEQQKLKKIEYQIDKEKYEDAKKFKKIDAKATFICSLYTGEVFGYEKDGENVIRRYARLEDDNANKIFTTEIDKPEPEDKKEKRKLRLSVGTATNLRKYHVDVLGNRYPAAKETLQMKLEM